MPRLTLAIADYDRVAALGELAAASHALDLDVATLAPSETFYRMLKNDEFDVSEMSLSSYLIARAQGRDWIALPVFPNRTTFHVNAYVRSDGGVAAPGDLAGRRFGLPEYQMTAALWLRGTYQHDFGLDPREVEWCIERKPSLSHGGETHFTPPPGVKLTQLEGATLADLLVAGELDAVMPSPYPGMTSRLNRTDAGTLATRPGIRRLFDDPMAEMDRYYADHGFLQINHIVVVQRERVQSDPDLPRRLYAAFGAAKQSALTGLDRLRRSSLVYGPLALERQQRTYGADPYPYGLAANRAALERLVGFSAEQGLISSAPSVDELFHESLRDT